MVGFPFGIDESVEQKEVTIEVGQTQRVTLEIP